MPTFMCTHCSEIVTVDGPVPDQCPTCGHTLHIEGDPTPTGPQLHSTVIQVLERRRTTIGRYVVQSKLGAGGFGSVFLAKDPQLDRLVAIKVPRGETGTSPIGLERFAREGRNAAQLRHPGIVSVFNVELDGELPFIVCEYVEGVSLSDRLRQGPFSFREAARLVAEIASALDYAHEHGIIHRDIKPSNIMISPDGKPRLMDFGLAKREAIDVTVTTDQAIIGTPAYMSPEQAWGGKQGTVDRRSDVYSLGTVMYHLLTREIPFHGEPRMVLRQVIQDDPKNPRSLNGDIPLDLETIVAKAMQKEPAARYQTAGALADDLNRWLRGEPIQARPVTRPERLWRWCRRNPAPAGLVGSVALLLIVLTIGSGVLAAVQSSARRRIAEALQENRRLLARAYVEKAAQYQQPGRSNEGYRPLKSLPWLGAALQFDESDLKRRDAARIRINTQLDFAPRIERMWFHKGGVEVVGLSPKRDLFFTGSPDGNVHIWRVAKSEGPVISFPHPAPVGAAAVSPDGTLLATGSADGIRLWEIASGKLRRGPFAPASPANKPRQPHHFRSVKFSESGSYLVTADDWAAQIWVVSSGIPFGLPLVGPTLVESAHFLDSERFLVTAHVDGSIRFWDIKTSTQKRVLFAGATPSVRVGIAHIAVAPDGVTVAGSIGPGGVGLWNAVLGEKVGQSLPHEGQEVVNLQFSPDGQLLATADGGGTVRLWKIGDGHLLWRRQVFSAEDNQGDTGRLEFAPDGQALVVTHLGTDISILDVRTGSHVAEPISSANRLLSAGWTDAPGHLLTVAGDGVARLWGIESREPAFRLPHRKEILQAAVSEDERVVTSVDRDGLCCAVRRTTGNVFEPGGIVSFPTGNRSDCIALNREGAKLAVASGRVVSLWDVSTGKQSGTDLLHASTVQNMRFAAAGNSLICISGDGQATIWDLTAGRKAYPPIAIAQGRPQMDLDVSGDGKRFAVAAITQVTVWDVSSGQRIGPPLLHDRVVQKCRFLPSSGLIVTGSFNGIAYVWDITTGRTVASTAKHSRPITGLDAASDGTMFLTGCADGTSRLWSAADGTPVSPTFEDGATVRHALLDPTSRWVATATDHTVHGWDPRLGESLFIRSLGQSELRFSGPRVGRSTDSGKVALTFFSSDSRSLHAVTSDGLFVTIRLDPERRSLEEMASEIALRSGVQFDSSGGLRILQPEQLAAIWQNRKTGR
jgi:WD40 repeat protein